MNFDNYECDNQMNIYDFIKTCGNCKYFLGGGDCGLACNKDYYKLPNENSEICNEFILKGE